MASFKSGKSEQGRKQKRHSVARRVNSAREVEEVMEMRTAERRRVEVLELGALTGLLREMELVLELWALTGLLREMELGLYTARQMALLVHRLYRPETTLPVPAAPETLALSVEGEW